MSQEKVITNSVWKKTQGGRCNYLYSGKKGSGAEAAVSVTLVDMADSGLEDLYVKLFFTVNYDEVGENKATGYDLSINDEEVFFTHGIWNHAGHASSVDAPQTYEFVLPASSKLKIIGLSETTTATRAVSLIAHPLKVVYS